MARALRLALGFLCALTAGCSASTNQRTSNDGGGAEGAPDSGACQPTEPADAYAPSQPFACNESLQTIPTRPGVMVSFDLVTPAQGQSPAAAVILLPGGGGLLGLSAQGIGQGADNFCVRTRQSFALAGFVVAVPDAPSDHPTGLDNFRATSQHAEDLSALVQWLRARYVDARVWVVGTSRGTISATDVLARFPPPAGPDHVVLTSSVTTIPSNATDQEDIQSVPEYQSKLAANVPLLMIDHALDACGASPPSGAQALAASIGDSSFFSLVDGGTPPPADANVCGGIAYHGFYGLDGQVVSQIVQFIGP